MGILPGKDEDGRELTVEMMACKKLWRLIIKLLQVWFVINVAVFLITCAMAILFPHSYYEMIAPWNKRRAAQYAMDYYYQSYRKEIELLDIDAFAYAQGMDMIYSYDVNLRLKEEPECEFLIRLGYDVENGELCIRSEPYIQQTIMKQRMKHEMWEEIERIYGKEYFVNVYFPFDYFIEETTDLESFKKQGRASFRLYVENHPLTEEQKSEEAVRLWEMYLCFVEKGYELEEVTYDGILPNSLFKKWWEMKTDGMDSLEDAQNLIEKAIQEESE